MSTDVKYGLPSDQYRARNGLSQSEAKQLRKSPYHFKRMREPRVPELVKASSPQAFLGTLAHTALLEPEDFDARYVVGPEISKNSNAWKAFAEDCAQRGIEPVSQQQRDTAFAMAESVRQLPDARMLLDGCATEASVFWHCPRTGVLCKARPDLLKQYPPYKAYPKGCALLADLKTTDDARPKAFAATVANYDYHCQNDWYMEGCELALGVPVLSFLWIVVERDFPYAARIYTLDDESLQLARRVNDATRRLYADCKKRNQWPSYTQEMETISLPHWYFKDHLTETGELIL